MDFKFSHSDCRMTRISCLLYLYTHSDSRMTRTSCLLYLCTHSDCRMTRTSCLLYLCTHSDCRMTRTSCLLYLYTHSDCRMTRTSYPLYLYTHSDSHNRMTIYSPNLILVFQTLLIVKSKKSISLETYQVGCSTSSVIGLRGLIQLQSILILLKVPQNNLTICTSTHDYVGIRGVKFKTENVVRGFEEQLRVDGVRETPDENERAGEQETRGEFYSLIK